MLDSPRRRLFTPEDCRRMAELYAAGIPPKEIAIELGRRPTTITQWMSMNLYPLRDENPSKTELIKQDAAFCAAMEKAIARGKERDPRIFVSDQTRAVDTGASEAMRNQGARQ